LGIRFEIVTNDQRIPSQNDDSPFETDEFDGVRTDSVIGIFLVV
jgi:hypothetical protein